jgi:hypothetical protein
MLLVDCHDANAHHRKKKNTHTHTYTYTHLFPGETPVPQSLADKHDR